MNKDLSMSFEQLVKRIIDVDYHTQVGAIKAVNKMATFRNWIIGAYIVEYEQCGNDRAKYGAKLIDNLSEGLKDKKFSSTLLKNSRSFYILYPYIGEYIKNSPTLLDFSNALPYEKILTDGVSRDIMEIRPTLSDKFETPAEILVNNLSFSHIVELLKIDDQLIRFFYETECIKGTWSVRELRRQIVSNLHIRVGLSEEKIRLMTDVNRVAEIQTNSLQIRDPYTFEFLGLKSREVCSEGDIEDALILHLQDFLLELGKGFCFEARQKRIIIDGEYYFVDLVFYNRLLHCNVIIELKNDEFRHEHIGQLNAYVSYYAENEMRPGDNPPVGILLCTRKGRKMVEYALGSLDNQLFVSTYQLQLPNRNQLEQFIRNECKTMLD